MRLYTVALLCSMLLTSGLLVAQDHPIRVVLPTHPVGHSEIDVAGVFVAHLDVDSHGLVKSVQIRTREATPSSERAFRDRIRAALSQWKYPEGSADRGAVIQVTFRSEPETERDYEDYVLMDYPDRITVVAVVPKRGRPPSP
jgi:hypothetical protein